MAKKSKRTPEEQRAFDERTRMIEEYLEKRRRRDAERRAASERSH